MLEIGIDVTDGGREVPGYGDCFMSGRSEVAYLWCRLLGAECELDLGGIREARAEISMLALWSMSGDGEHDACLSERRDKALWILDKAEEALKAGYDVIAYGSF